MNEELKNWLQDFINKKQQQGINCKLTSYKTTKSNKFLFEVNGELRNIENYFTIAELSQYKKLINGQKNNFNIK